MHHRNRGAGELLADRRALLGQVLESYRKQGGKVLWPAKEDSYSDVAFDDMDVDSLLEALKKGESIKLSRFMAQSSHQKPNASSMDNTTSTPSHHLMSSIDSAWETPPATEPVVPSINLSELEIGLDEYDLQEIAFTIFSLFCTEHKDEQMVDSIRRQLELSSDRGEDIIRMILPFKDTLCSSALGSIQGSPSVCESGRDSQDLGSPTSACEPTSPTDVSDSTVKSRDSTGYKSNPDLEDGPNLELILRLLLNVRPSNFKKFKDFVRWRNAAAHILVETLRHASLTSWKGPQKDISNKSLVARLRGAVRRISCVDSEDFDEEEYSEAAEALGMAANELVKFTSSGWQFSWGLKVKLWEALLLAVFDDLEGGMYISVKDKYLGRLQKYLAPKLGISSLLHRACYAWVHFEKFVKYMKPEFMAKVRVLLEDLNRIDAREALPSDLDVAFAQQAINEVVKWVQVTLLDYHLTLDQNQNLMDGMLGLLVASQSTEETRQDLVVKCISSSCLKAFHRLIPEDTNEDRVIVLAKLAEQTMDLFEVELIKYTKFLAPFCSSAASVAARELHEAYGQEFLPEFAKIDSLADDNIRFLHAVNSLEENLMPHLLDNEDKPNSSKRWKVLKQIEPVLIEVVRQKVDQLCLIAGRLCEAEDWAPVSANDHVSHSAVELQKLLMDSAASMFEINLPFPAHAVDMFLNCFSDAVVKYGEQTAAGLGNQSDLIPPLPVMTRFKKDIATAAEKAECPVVSRMSSHKKLVSRVKDIMKDPLPVTVVPAITDSKVYDQVSNITLPNLLLRINSLQFLKESVHELANLVESNWVAHCENADLEMPPRNHVTSALSMIGKSLDQSLDTCCDYLGTKIVFWDMRRKWLENLYRHKVTEGAIISIMDNLNDSLASISGIALPGVLDSVASGLMTSCAKCYERVLLDGGPYRLFVPSDLDILDADVANLKSLFLADGEGLQQEKVDNVFRQVSTLISLMGLETRILLENANKATANTSEGDQMQAKDMANNLDVLTKILSHRRDRDASKWLKRQFKTPKKLK